MQRTSPTNIFVCIIAAWVSAFYFTLVHIDQDRCAAACLTHLVRSLLAQAMQADVCVQNPTIFLGLGKAYVRDIHINDADRTWAWYLKTLELTFSLSDLLIHRSLFIHAQLHHTDVRSGITPAGISIAPTIMRLFSANTTGFINICHITITNSSCTLTHDKGVVQTQFAADLPLVGTNRISRIWLHNGSVQYRTQRMATIRTGTYAYHHHKHSAEGSCTLVVTLSPHTSPHVLHATTQYHNGIGHIKLHSEAASASLQCTTGQEDGDMTLSGTIPITLLASFAPIPAQITRFGECTFTAAHLTTQPSLSLSCGDHSLTCQLTPAGSYQGTLKIHDLATLSRPLLVDFAGDFSTLTISSAWNEHVLTGQLTLTPVPYITHLCIQKNSVPLVTLDTTGGILQGSWDLAACSSLLEPVLGATHLGEGTCTFRGTITPFALEGTLGLAQATLRIPALYNLIESASGDVSCHFSSQTCTMRNVAINFHQGTVKSSLIRAAWKEGRLAWLTMPYVAENCLISWKKDLFGLVSGTGTVQYDQESCSVHGKWSIERGYLRNNLFFLSGPSYQTGSNLFKKIPLHLDITASTRKPISVKSPFLETQAHTTLTIQGTADKPLIHGTITLTAGTINFPYKPLYIHQGTATVQPPLSIQSSSIRTSNSSTLHQPDFGYETTSDPTIALIAENLIKGYRIRLTVQGSLSNPELTFTSTPHLSQEQIIALLFGGTEDGSLYAAMSSYIMHSLKQLLFGPNEQSSTLLQSLKNLFKPFGSVRFVPSFTDQSSRGGVRGSLEVEVNERLRGTIKQNFELPQDVLIEVEYDLSDEARARAFTDERGDLGAEVEASWKF